jgi:hypothetical protein
MGEIFLPQDGEERMDWQADEQTSCRSLIFSEENPMERFFAHVIDAFLRLGEPDS